MSWSSVRCRIGQHLRWYGSRVLSRPFSDATCFAPLKNNKAHDVSLSGPLAPRLAAHIRQHPPVAVTLPWKEPGGKLATFTLLVTRPGGEAMNRTRFNDSHWRPAREKAGIVPAPKPGEKRPRPVSTARTSNQSAETILLESVKPVPLVSGMLKVLSWRWDPCGFDNDGIAPDTVALGPGETTWVTAVAQPLIACPVPAPLQFQVTYSINSQKSTFSLPGFPDLSAVHYSGCPTPAA